jgi:hypothetical protein
LSSLKRTGASLKRTCTGSAKFDFSFRALVDQSEPSKMFLLTCLISVYTFNPTGTSFESNWTWICEIHLTFEKWSKNADFSKTCFSPEIEEGLRLYNVYMISKIGCDWFHQVLTCFALKMGFFCKKNDKARRTL